MNEKYSIIIFLRERGGDYGLQRVWATLAAIVGGPLAGFILDLDYGEREGSKFFIVFVAFFCIRMLSAILIFRLDLKFKKKSTAVLKYLSDDILEVSILVLNYHECEIQQNDDI